MSSDMLYTRVLEDGIQSDSPTIAIQGYIGAARLLLVLLVLDIRVVQLLMLLELGIQQFPDVERSRKLDPLDPCVAARAATEALSWYDR